MGLFLTLVSRLPLPLLYAGAWLLSLPLFYLLRYRRREARDNLRRAFPDWTEAQVARACRLTYFRLAEVLAETIKLQALSAEAIKKRVRLIGADRLGWDKRTPIIIVGAHQGNWEWLFQRLVLQSPHNAYGIYKPLHNRVADRFIKKVRARFGVEMVAYRDFGRHAARRRQDSCIMMGDQSPSSHKGIVWVRFFGRQTAFYSGLARLSAMFQLPVFYVSLKRVRRGVYQAEFESLGVAGKGEEEAFTQLYASKIEAAVSAYPEGWLWTHRRWKRSPPQPATRAGL